MDNNSRFEKFLEKLSGRVTNIVLLGFFATLFSIPIFTIGASFTAVFKAMDDYLNNDNQKPLKIFFASFKKYFKLSTLVWLLHIIVCAILVWDYVYYCTGGATIDYIGRAAIFTIACLLVFELNMVFIVIASEMASTVKEAFNLAIDIAFICFVESIELLVLALAVPIVAVFLFQGLLLIIPGVIAYLDWKILPKMLKKYRFKSNGIKYRQQQRNIK